MKKSEQIKAISQKVMSSVQQLIDATDYVKQSELPTESYSQGMKLKEEAEKNLKAFADEYAVLKFYYSPQPTCKMIGDIDHNLLGENHGNEENI